MKPSVNDRRNQQNYVEAVNRSNYELSLVRHVPVRFAYHSLIDRLLLSMSIKDEPSPSIIIMNDVIPSILSYCDATTLAKAACVCREWHTLCNNDDLWENLCRQQFGVSALELKPAPDPVKELYILSHKQLRSICTLTNQSLSGIRSIPNVIPMSSISQLM